MTDKRCPHGWLNHADCEVCQLIIENESLRQKLADSQATIEGLNGRFAKDQELATTDDLKEQ